MADLKGSKTEDNLKAAFAGESQANRRYLYFAQKADVEGYNDVAVVFRSTAEGETGHAHGHLEFLEEVGDPATGLPIGGTPESRRRIAGETHEYTDMYPGMAKTAARRRGSTKWPIGSRLWQKPRNHTPGASRRSSISPGLSSPLSRGLGRQAPARPLTRSHVKVIRPRTHARKRRAADA